MALGLICIPKDGCFKNDKGEKIKEIKKDTRVLRFINGWVHEGLDCARFSAMAADDDFLAARSCHRKARIWPVMIHTLFAMGRSESW